jgi:hypothetical protein
VSAGLGHPPMVLFGGPGLHAVRSRVRRRANTAAVSIVPINAYVDGSGTVGSLCPVSSLNTMDPVALPSVPSRLGRVNVIELGPPQIEPFSEFFGAKLTK